jgi:RNA polymerase sigma factor (TIGR02999 family)
MLQEEVRRIAQMQFAKEGKGHTLQPTALVNEAFIRLSGQRNLGEMDRAAFLAAVAKTIQRVLIDHAKGKGRKKRGGDAKKLDIEPDQIQHDIEETDHEGIAAVLERLAELSPRQAEVVRMRFYASATVEQIAVALGVSERTVHNDWSFARAWLVTELERQRGSAEA